jgi:hypothetical protein
VRGGCDRFLFCRGKGDYHRLGHGTGEHVRRPKKVAALQGKKIISIATGSLHCVACSDEGEVFTWGDNDEGQLGDDTTNAIQRPRLVSALQGKKITNVACGSAHTLAWSTNNASSACARLPSVAPLEYDLLQDIPTWVLHRRLILLYHFAELICPCITMFPITGPDSLHELRSILIYTIKEATFRKVVQATMVRDKHHGPVIELNRIQVKRSRSRGGLAGVDGMKSVFGQMVMKLGLLTSETLALPHRVWKVEFVGKFDVSFLCTWIVFWCGRGERRRLRRRLQREHRRDVRRTPKRFLAVVDSDTERARRRRPQPGLFHPEPVVQDVSQLEHVQVFGGADGNRDPHRFAAQLEPGRACVETTGRDGADAGRSDRDRQGLRPGTVVHPRDGFRGTALPKSRDAVLDAVVVRYRRTVEYEVQEDHVRKSTGVRPTGAQFQVRDGLENSFERVAFG